MKYSDQRHQYIRTFANCFVTRGIVRSVFIDAYRGGFDFIPNDLADLLEQAEEQPLSAIYRHYGEENTEILDEYLSFLLDKEYIFFVDEAERKRFPALDTGWDIPAVISNAILDVDELGVYALGEVIRELSDLQCQALHLRIYRPVSFEWLIERMREIHESTIENVEIFVPYQPDITDDNWKWLALNYQKIISLYIHSAPEVRQIREDYIDRIATLAYVTQVITDEHHCGQVALPYFSTNIFHYSESLEHNTCLNRKIAVDKHGMVRNCPSMPRHFGSYRPGALKSALAVADFKTFWRVSKDQINDCKVCEFRRICTDCRAYVQDEDHNSGKPAKCAYDPYTGKWH